MRILITARRVFVGSPLAERLVGRGAELICLPRLGEWLKAYHDLD